MCRHNVDQLAVEGPEHTEGGVAQRGSAFHDRIEDRLNVRGRARDYPQDLARCGQIAIPRLQLREEPHVLDGDHRLMGEGLEQFHLPIGKESGRGSGHDDRPDGTPVAQHWHGHEASIGHGPGDAQNAVGGVRLNVRNLGGCPAQNRSARGGVLSGWPRESFSKCRKSLRGQAMTRREVQALPVELEDEAELPVAELPGAPGEQSNMGCASVGALAMTSQDLSGRRLVRARLGEGRFSSWPHPRGAALRRLAGHRALGFGLSLRGLFTSPHAPHLAARRVTTATSDDRLGQRPCRGKRPAR